METTDPLKFSWWDVQLRTPMELAEEYRAVLAAQQSETAPCPYLGGFTKPWDYTCTSYLVRSAHSTGTYHTALPWMVPDVVPVLPFQTVMAVAIFDEPGYLDVLLRKRPHWEPQQLVAAVHLDTPVDPVREAVVRMDLMGADLMAEWAMVKRPQRAKYIAQVRGGKHSDWAWLLEVAKHGFRGWKS